MLLDWVYYIVDQMFELGWWAFGLLLDLLEWLIGQVWNLALNLSYYFIDKFISQIPDFTPGSPVSNLVYDWETHRASLEVINFYFPLDFAITLSICWVTFESQIWTWKLISGFVWKG